MLILLSPAKTLNFEPVSIIGVSCSQPAFLPEAKILVQHLRQLSPSEVSSLMKISDKLGKLNAERYQTWDTAFNNINAKPALLAFQGDVYQGLAASSFSPEDFEFAQQHLRILSGLYGVLKPLDLIQPYRLEMGTKLAHPKLQSLGADTLDQYWQDKPTKTIAQDLARLQQQVVVNLASNEYFKVINPQSLSSQIVTPVFKDWKNGQYKIISFYAKKARGMMARYIIKNRLQAITDLQSFAESGYTYNSDLSSEGNLVFTRD